MRPRNAIVNRMTWLLLAGMLLATQSGCVGIMAQLVRVGGGDLKEAEFKGLKGKRVAVVCVSQQSAYGPGEEARQVGNAVERSLKKEVRRIKIIDQDQIAEWIDSHDWNEIDYREIGKGLKADMVVGIDLASYSIAEGGTLLKGRSQYAVKVYDMTKGGKIVWSRTDGPPFEFPKTGARYRDATNEAKFKRRFVAMLGQHIARYFHAYPYAEEVALDAAFQD